jgi:hypothetical protein
MYIAFNIRLHNIALYYKTRNSMSKFKEMMANSTPASKFNRLDNHQGFIGASFVGLSQSLYFNISWKSIER